MFVESSRPQNHWFLAWVTIRKEFIAFRLSYMTVRNHVISLLLPRKSHLHLCEAPVKIVLPHACVDERTRKLLSNFIIKFDIVEIKVYRSIIFH